MLARVCRNERRLTFLLCPSSHLMNLRNIWHDQSSAENLRLMFKRLHVSLALGKFMRIHRWRFTCLAFYMARDKFFWAPANPKDLPLLPNFALTSMRSSSLKNPRILSILLRKFVELHLHFRAPHGPLWTFQRSKDWKLEMKPRCIPLLSSPFSFTFQYRNCKKT